MLVLRLRARLLVSYAVVTALLVAAFSQMAVGLMRTLDLVASVRQEELASFEQEQRVYVAAWALELAVRRGVVACEQSVRSAPTAHRAVASARQELQAALGAGTAPMDEGIRASARDYVSYALQLEQAGTCESMLSIPLRERRLKLDEALTTVWSERTRDMRLAIQAKEDHARALGSAALRSGGLFGLLGILAAGALAFAQARAVSNSVALLSTHARRIGQGDFSPLPPLRGPEELRALSLDLDRMRGRLAELDQLKSAFVASVSHDLRTPLARVREALSLLGDGSTGPLTPQQARVVKLAQAACEREIRMVTSVLDLSRVQSGQPLQRNAGASVDLIVQNVLRDLAFEADERKVQLVYEAAAKPVRAPIDDPLVERALSNLVSNAIAVSSAGKTVRITCELVSRKRPGAASPVPAVQLSVADQGPGVPVHARDWIFRPFASLEVGGRRSTGLGLTIAREMITAHGGELSLADSPGPGATFTFWIPLEDPSSLEPALTPESPIQQPHVLLVDDDLQLAELMSMRMTSRGYRVTVEGEGRSALRRLGQERVDAMVLDLRLEDMDGMDVLRAARQRDPELAVIMLTAHGSIETAVQAMQEGAYGFLTKPFHDHELMQKLVHALERSRLRREVAELRRRMGEEGEPLLLGISEAISRVREVIARIAPTDATVLLTGESGTGKELAARMLHVLSRRGKERFVAVNCGALPPELLESELFGHVKGAFSGAVREREGLFGAANGGTLFLDEVGEASPSVQVKLLRVLQEQRLTRVGADVEEPVDVRVVAATNRDLAEEVAAKRFRQDLYFRLHVVPIELPPLRERLEDIPLLAQLFLERTASRYGLRPPRLAPATVELMQRYGWPGNVRELIHEMEAAVLLAGADELQPRHVPRLGQALERPPAGSAQLPGVPGGTDALPSLREARDAFERAYLAEALRRSGGSVSAAARMAGRNRSDFYDLLKRHNLSASDFKGTSEGGPAC